MKKYLLLSLIFLFIAILFLIQPSQGFAAILYSNTFNNTPLSDWTPWSPSDSCNDTSGVLMTFSNTRCAIKFNSTFPNLACIAADFDTTITSSDYLFLTGVVGGTGLGNWDIVFSPDNGSRHIVIGDGPTNVRIDSLVSTPIGIHNYMLCKDGDIFRGYVDDTEVVNFNQPGRDEDSFSIVTNGSSNQASNPISNFFASSSLPNTPTPTPTSAPTPTPLPTNTPTPTITPTPTPPVSNDLPVPIIKQTTNPWQSHEYDTAHIWSPTDITIHDWGCALTSVVMILQYNGITRMPDNSPVNPDTLNNWLEKQSDGYVGSGWVNWLAISRLSHLAKLSGHNPLFFADALEYTRKGFADTISLDLDLGLHTPDILEEPGHFVVVKGKSGNTYDINDPYYDRHTLNDGYNNTFLSLGEYIPSFTNLSYLMFTTSTQSALLVIDSQGRREGSNGFQIFNEIPGGSYYIQQGIQNPATGAINPPLQILLIPKPQDGKYTMQLFNSSNEIQTIPLQVYSYDIDGNVIDQAFPTTLASNASKTITFSYEQESHKPFFCENVSEKNKPLQILCKLVDKFLDK